MGYERINIKGELPLEGVQNARDLGGYICCDGKRITKYHRLIRSGGVSAITEEDIRILCEYGVNSILDLRDAYEDSLNPSPLKNRTEFEFANIPLSVMDMKSDMTKENSDFDMLNGYVKRIESKETINKIFRYFIEHIDKNILFHCIAGKDRTGLIVLILFGLFGVKKADIRADYEVSHTYMLNNKVFLDAFSIARANVFYSKGEHIDQAYDYVIEKYGSFSKYLVECSISIEDQKKIINSFTEEI